MCLDELDEEVFEGKVAPKNWAMTRAQRIIRDISFETNVHDIYSPKFSSCGDNTDEDQFEYEEAEGKICDERFSELNPCDDSVNNSISRQSSQLWTSQSSNKTQLERCHADLYDSENLPDDEIRESIAQK